MGYPYQPDDPPPESVHGAANTIKCRYCNGTGSIAIRSRDGSYAFPGPVPDDAKGYADADCWHCDSGPPPAVATKQ